MPETTETLVKDRVKRLDGFIRMEFELTAQRLNYTTASEAFLFAAYTLVQIDAEKQNEHMTRLSKAIPVIGSAVAVVALFAVLASISMLHELKDERRSIDDAECGIGVPRDVNTFCWQHVFGLLPPLLIPVAFLVGWIYIDFVVRWF